MFCSIFQSDQEMYQQICTNYDLKNIFFFLILKNLMKNACFITKRAEGVPHFRQK